MQNVKEELMYLTEKYGRVQSLMKFVNLNTLKNAYWHVMKSNVVGVGTEYGKNLDENLSKLLTRMKKFAYYPQSRDGVSDARNLKHEFKVFEDMIVAEVFRDILVAIYEVKGCVNTSSRLKDWKFGVNSRPIRIALSIFCKASLICPMSNVEKDKLIVFLKENIADKNFMRYIKRFLQCENPEYGNQLESDARGSLSSMFVRIFIYHMLRDGLISKRTEVSCKMRLWMKRGIFIFAYPYSRDLFQLKQMILNIQNECGIKIDFANQYRGKTMYSIWKTSDYVLDEEIVQWMMY